MNQNGDRRILALDDKHREDQAGRQLRQAGDDFVQRECMGVQEHEGDRRDNDAEPYGELLFALDDHRKAEDRLLGDRPQNAHAQDCQQRGKLIQDDLSIILVHGLIAHCHCERDNDHIADLVGKEAADEQAEILERMRFPFPESGSIEAAEEHNAEDAEQAVGAELDESGDSLVVDRCQVIKPVKGQNQENISSSEENQREQMRLACGGDACGAGCGLCCRYGVHDEFLLENVKGSLHFRL